MANADFERRKYTTLITNIRNLGIEIPEDIQAEVELCSKWPTERGKAQSDYTTALHKLREVPADKFHSAKDALAKAKAALDAVNDAALENALLTRLQFVVDSASPDWELAVVEQFNGIVEHYNLNAVFSELPVLDGPSANQNVLNVSRAQIEALDTWRTAVAKLGALWSVYGKMAKFKGYEEFGDSNVLSANLFQACVLGNPRTLTTAIDTATKFTSANEPGTLANKQIGKLAPFIVPLYSGYELRLSTLADATTIRREIQETANGGVGITQMVYE